MGVYCTRTKYPVPVGGSVLDIPVKLKGLQECVLHNVLGLVSADAQLADIAGSLLSVLHAIDGGCVGGFHTQELLASSANPGKKKKTR
jgi:hypothetical protein